MVKRIGWDIKFDAVPEWALELYGRKVFKEIGAENIHSESALRLSLHLTTPKLIKKFDGFCPGAMPLTANALESPEAFYKFHISFLPAMKRLRTAGLECLNEEYAALTEFPTRPVEWASDKVLHCGEDPIYLRKDLIELHTDERWKKEAR